MTISSHSRRLRRFLAAALAGIAAAAVAAVPAYAAQAASPPAAPPPASRPGLLSQAQAFAKARAAGRPVIASALTTPASLTTVSPAGIDTVTETLLPTRAWRGGAWHALNADLASGPGGTVVPAMTAAGLTLSGGGSGPLAVMNNHGRTLSVSWPAPLPAPQLSGPTATYQDVLPGVNLAVTVTSQGGFSEVLIVTSAAAAANPGLARLVLQTSSPGLQLSAGTGGNLTVAAGATAQPVFSAPAPAMWDSASLPAGTKTATGTGGTTLAVPSGMPAGASASAPGAGSHVARIPLTVSGGAIVMSPPPGALTGPGVTYPVYIDPSFESDPVSAGASNWTQVESDTPNESYWDESGDLQMGRCDWTSQCGGTTFYARSLFTMPVPSQITRTTTVDSAYLYMTDAWSSICTAETVQLWRTGAISSSTTFSNQPGWSTYQHQSFDYGCPGHSYTKNNVTWNVTGGVQGAAGGRIMTFGLRAPAETASGDDVFWKQFLSGAGNITLTVSYHNPPSQPASLQNAPAGACQTSPASPALIGNDDITLSAVVGDVDDAEVDSNLTTTFTVVSSATGATVATIPVTSVNVAGGAVVTTGDISSATVQGWGGSNGASTPESYSWYAVTGDSASPVLTSTQSATCYFLYNPAVPSQVGATTSPSAPIGKTVTATFTPPSGCSPTSNPCPASYTYQAGVATPVTVTPDNTPASGDWTGSIPVTQTGPIQLTVYGSNSAGNPGPPSAGFSFTGTAPATAYPDGYYTGGSYPSVLTTGTGPDPSLWLSPGTGNGTLSPPIDIGSLGTGINPGSDGPADWSGAQVLHGNFNGRGIQDVMAYYPATGTAVLIGGSAATAPLQPITMNTTNIPAGTAFSDPSLADNPTTLVAAGNASELGSTYSDVIGIIGDPADGYVLDLFSTSGTCVGFNNAGGYSYCQTLSSQAPDPGDPSWGDYTLATTQLPDSANKYGDPANIALFALNTKDGTLYETTNPSMSSTTPVGSGTWTQLTVPWGSTTPSLVSADINNAGQNNAGQTELWTMSGTTLTPYVVSGSSVTAENTGTAISYPAHDWPITDGTGNPSAAAATDTIAGLNASLSSTGAAWGQDDYFGGDIQLNPTDTGTGALATSGPAVNTAGSYTVSAWVKLNSLTTGTPVVAAQDGTNDSGFYLGYLGDQGCWDFNFATSDTTNPGFDAICGPAAQVGTWTNLVGVYNAGTSTAQLYVNGTLAGTTSYTAWAANGPFTIGRDLYDGSPGDYLNGSIADVQTWNTALTTAQVTALYP